MKPLWIIAAVVGAMSLGLAGFAGMRHYTTVKAADAAPIEPIPATATLPATSTKPNDPAANAAPMMTTLPAGTRIAVRLNESVSSKNSPGHHFTATVSEPVVIDGNTVIPNGAQAHGVVVDARSSGRLKGRAHVALALQSIAFDGKSYDLDTRSFGAASKGHKKRNWLSIGGTSGTGALIGGLAAGPAGMAIGAGAGAGAGTIFAAATGKKSVTVPAETRINFALREPTQIARN